MSEKGTTSALAELHVKVGNRNDTPETDPNETMSIFPALKGIMQYLLDIDTAYSSEQVTNVSGGAEETVIKATPGKTARVRCDSAITVTLRDGATDLWTLTGAGAELDLGGTPLSHSADIRLHLSDDGDAWIIYK